MLNRALEFSSDLDPMEGEKSFMEAAFEVSMSGDSSEDDSASSGLLFSCNLVRGSWQP